MNKEENKIKSLTFFYAAPKVGGIQLLFIRLANYLSDLNYKVYYIDYTDGFSRDKLNKKVNIINYFGNNVLTINHDTFLITPLSNLISILTGKIILSKKVKLFFWCVHPYELLDFFPLIITFKKIFNLGSQKIKKYLDLLFKKDIIILKNLTEFLYNYNSFVFMDNETFTKSKELLELNIDNPNYLPIPLEKSLKIPNYNLINNDEINIAWLGRLVDFKIFPLINLIENSNISVQKFNKKINLHIIGSGNKEHLIKNINISDKLNIIYKGTMVGNELEEYLLNKVDILFAMGTSCLEGARLGIPSVCYDYSYNYIHLDYKFNWLYQFMDFVLGREINTLKAQNINTFDEILNEIYINNNKKLIGEKSHDYFLNNHEIKAVSKLLITKLNNNNVKYSDLINNNIHKLSLKSRILANLCVYLLKIKNNLTKIRVSQ